jgi:hypothetical protein
MFESESEMSYFFEKFMKKNHGNAYVKELTGYFGIPDFVYYDKSNEHISIISFELKLRDWKRAIIQAFRYRSFSELSYVVLPTKCKSNITKNIDQFKHFNIGLATFDKNDGLTIIYKPEKVDPYSVHLYEKAINEFRLSRKKSKNLSTFYTPSDSLELSI